METIFVLLVLYDKNIEKFKRGIFVIFIILFFSFFNLKYVVQNILVTF